MAGITTTYFTADDGVRLAVHEMGEGHPVILLHGLFSNARTNWVKYGAAEEIVSRGFRLIMPDLRGHGESDAPHDAAAYPPDVLVDDGFALVRHLGLADREYDFGGYSLGGRTTARLLIKGLKPRRAVVAGMGLRGLLHTVGRGDFFRRVLADVNGHARGSAEWMAAQFLKTTGGDPDAVVHLLDTFVDSSEEELRSIDTRTLIIAGNRDDDNGSSEDLAAILPNAVHETIPGNHMTAVTRPDLGRAIVDFLAG